MQATSISDGLSPVFSQILGPAVREYISVGSPHSLQPAPPCEFDDPTSHIGGCLVLRAMSSPTISTATAPSTSDVQSSTRNGSLIQRAARYSSMVRGSRRRTGSLGPSYVPVVIPF